MREIGLNWAAHLPWTLLGLSATPKEATNLSSTEAVLGVSLVLHGEFFVTAEADFQNLFTRFRSDATLINAHSGPQGLVLAWCM
jgi:hypothetical protein